jgi:hypothetical protein
MHSDPCSRAITKANRALLGQTADRCYNQPQMQDVLNKLNEFLNAARR